MLLVTIILILVIIVGLLSVSFLMYRKQIQSLEQQLDFIRRNDTNRHLELSIRTDELQKLAEQINAILRKAREEKVILYKAEQAFKEAITNVSHDLRTPLTSVVGYLDMLKKGKITDAERDEYYLIMKKRIRHLVQMLDELFEFARIESGEYKLIPEKVDAGQIFLETIYSFHYDFVAKNTEPQLVFPDGPVYINGDTEILRRVFENVIRNALTHGKGDLKVHIEKSNRKAVIQLQNHAPGLQNQEIQKLFERFYTVDRSRQRKTSGLGLSITRRLVEMMDGEIAAEKKNQYLVVSIRFDLIN